jgi:hypothetical protein
LPCICSFSQLAALYHPKPKPHVVLRAHVWYLMVHVCVHVYVPKWYHGTYTCTWYIPSMITIVNAKVVVTSHNSTYVRPGTYVQYTCTYTNTLKLLSDMKRAHMCTENHVCTYVRTYTCTYVRTYMCPRTMMLCSCSRVVPWYYHVTRYFTTF